MARARRRIVRGGPRRKLLWARLVSPTSLVVPTTGLAVDLLANFRTAGGDTLGCTVTRVITDVQYRFTTPPDADVQLTVGILVDQLQSQQAEVPRPRTEPHADWMWWLTYFPTESESVLVGSVASTGVAQFHADVKAQRKMDELGETLWMSFNRVSVADMAVVVNSSVLLRLP